MFKKTVKGDLKFPSHMSEECADLIGKLLQLDPANRIGMQRRGVLDIKKHAWFEGFDWAAFEARTMPAPYVPVVRPFPTRFFWYPGAWPAYFGAGARPPWGWTGHRRLDRLAGAPL